ncbi:uncharacterized protein LOC126372849 isoform X2 [Pectinophora gossypiella]|uniref:uncharacterized protein LOC126372849 isoform X2 n=1 Tax=Pectinophora gossypiella TaxID=13191 RepID=UPI00214F1800|nr:uncharacterized protein LOC126372849 isoform X2 [Pectinophora gossypiella]
MEKEKIVFKGSHPDSLYRVPTGAGAGDGRMARIMRALRWPAALLIVCGALAVFVYFLMPDNLDADQDAVNSTYWENNIVKAGVPLHIQRTETTRKPVVETKKPAPIVVNNSGAPKTQKTPEIDFYDADSEKSFDLISIIDSISEKKPDRKLPIPPVFPVHLTPEVQYGNEKADKDKGRTPKILDNTNKLHEDSTLKPHITQKPEKPLAIYFKDAVTTVLNSETFTKAESSNDYTAYEKSKSDEEPSSADAEEKPKPYPVLDAAVPPEVQEFYGHRPADAGTGVHFTSGHSKYFGIGIEDAEKMRSTTQSSIYNTRVSPTLPTWRDNHESTTKNYPININIDVPQCHSPRLALCRGVLPYDLAGPAPTIGGMEITSMLQELEYLVSTNCSERVRQFACSLLEPECNPPPFPPKTPCYSLCKAVLDSCEAHIAPSILPAFRCKQYENNNCMKARAPCYRREVPCGDGTCVPREWVCDGTNDCPAGDDEKQCNACDSNQFRCSTGQCIMRRWLCDGYLDCPDGDDERVEVCEKEGVAPRTTPGDVEPGEEPAGSAPAPSVRRPNRLPEGKRRTEISTGDNDSKEELLITSDSINSLKRNYTRRPSMARLTPYRPKSRTKTTPPPVDDEEDTDGKKVKPLMREFQSSESIKTTSPKWTPSNDGNKDPLDDDDDDQVKLLEEMEKVVKGPPDLTLPEFRTEKPKVPLSSFYTANPTPQELAKNVLKTGTFDRVIDGSALLKKAIEAQEAEKARLANLTTPEEFPIDRTGATAHSSPCPSGELRCVDGLCITLAQLCDGTIDCSDHADEDNCYT